MAVGGRAPAPRQALTLIVNPIATTVTPRRTEQLRAALSENFEVTLVSTTQPGHATQLAAAAVAEEAAVVAVYGGDGTTNEAIRALSGTQTALAHLPGGNASVLARMLGMGSDALTAARRIGALGAATQAIDLGEIDGRPFAFTVGIGLDAAVVKMVDGDVALKRRLRWGAFWLEAVRAAREAYFGTEPLLTIESGGEQLAGITAIVQNGEHYTYLGSRGLQVGEGATLTSGTLAASALLPGLCLRDVPTITARTVGPMRAGGHPHIGVLPASPEVVVRCKEPLPMQVDGDYWRDVTEARFSVRPAALRVLRFPHGE